MVINYSFSHRNTILFSTSRSLLLAVKFDIALLLQKLQIIIIILPDLIIIKHKKRTCKTVGFAVPVDHKLKLKESEKKDEYCDLPRELKKTVEHESDVYTNYNWCYLYSHQRIHKETGELGNKRTSGDHPNYLIVEIDQNTEKSPGYLRKLALTQTPVNANMKN